MPAGIYLHIPFCKSRCSYCDFATDVYRDGDTVERYVSALCSEIECFETAEEKSGLPHVRASAVEAPRPRVSVAACYIDTVYFGGGTPSLLSPKQL